MNIRNPLLVVATAAALTACGGMMRQPMAYSQDTLPDTVKVPSGHRVAMETVGTGQITYECRAKADMAGAHEWVFVGPDAKLWDRKGTQVGRYWGPPATWENNDGSKLTATQVAVAPAGAGNIPLQLVKANPAMGAGAMQNVSFIQRVATRGGVAPAMACGAQNLGQKQVVQYQADYIFWKQG
ncbi:DUF3455 domain-containing protein [Ramlibacter sp.]|uniref:DUF3455 domain-containing protein n=1 Tax=Ramlibacter sp. TaxID=1917967 RepID=UPI003D0EF885